MPLNVSIFAWRLLNKRIPIKDNYARHEILQPCLVLCLSGYGKEKWINHLFLDCEIFGYVWSSILHCLRIYIILPSDIGMLASHFTGTYIIMKDICTCFQIIWMTNNHLLLKLLTKWSFIHCDGLRHTCLVYFSIFMSSGVIRLFVLVTPLGNAAC